MKRALLLAVLCAPLAGCRVMAHSFERVTIERHEVIELETLSETWNPPEAAGLAAESREDGVLLTATGVQHGTRHERFREHVRIEERCARRAVAGIFEAPDSFWGVCDDVWVSLAFLGAFLTMHADSGVHDEVLLVFLAMGVVPLAVDALTFIPWWIAGHDWKGPCDYVAETQDLGETSGERDVPAERDVALGGAEVVVKRGKGGEVLARLKCGVEGTARATLRDLVAWTRGNGGELEFAVEAGGATATARVEPGAVLNGPGGTPADWRAPRGGASPDLSVEARVRGNTLMVIVRNRGAGDAWQVAAIVASADPAADGRVAALGRVRPGETVEARIALPPGSTTGALDFSEAFGRAPGAVPFGAGD
ncbi:MAG: hypothetical protein IT452_04910 [Planctomycetia bacterium]|nr:hypothetical protein [Planctomycetia bacterium]